MWGGSSEHATIQVPNIQPLCNFTLPIAPGARWEEFPKSASTAPKIPQAPAESTSCHWSFCSQTRSCWRIPPTHSTEEKNKTRNFLTSSFLFFFLSEVWPFDLNHDKWLWGRAALTSKLLPRNEQISTGWLKSCPEIRGIQASHSCSTLYYKTGLSEAYSLKMSWLAE